MRDLRAEPAGMNRDRFLRPVDAAEYLVRFCRSGSPWAGSGQSAASLSAMSFSRTIGASPTAIRSAVANAKGQGPSAPPWCNAYAIAPK
jgi:hypothetical protein